MIVRYVQLCCDHPDCSNAYEAPVNELESARAQMAGAREAGWDIRHGRHYCPGHVGHREVSPEEAAMVAVIDGLAAKGLTDREIAEGLEMSRPYVQRMRSRAGIPAGSEVKP